MPTGYTAKLMEEGESFDSFVLRCARAMGACVLMRDEPMDKPIPERFEPSDYSVKKLADARAELTRLEEMGGNERIAFGEKRRQEAIQRWTDLLKKERSENERLTAMRQQIAAWNPPSPDHTGFKDFMLDQIRISMNKLDYWEEALREADLRAPVHYYAEAVKEAERDIAYHTKAHAEEVERTEQRNRWLKQLRESLKCPTAA